jgi:Ribonuclease HepT-like
VTRRIEIIGEAAAHLTDETRHAIPELPFRKMRGMRNIVAHDLRQRGFEDRLGSGDRARAANQRGAGEVLRPPAMTNLDVTKEFHHRGTEARRKIGILKVKDVGTGPHRK